MYKEHHFFLFNCLLLLFYLSNVTTEFKFAWSDCIIWAITATWRPCQRKKLVWNWTRRQRIRSGKVKSTTLQELIGLGKDLGYSGKELQLFVAGTAGQGTRGEEVRARSQKRGSRTRNQERRSGTRSQKIRSRTRNQERRSGKRSQERRSRKRSQERGSRKTERGSSAWRKWTQVEGRNGYPQSSWSLAFRAAVAGTKLETIASLGEFFDDIKKEVLLAHGYTAEQLWKQLTTIKQGDESFRQMFWRATTKLGQFFKLAVKDENVTVELMTGTLIKYMVLEGCSNELRAYFLEKTLSSITCDEFQEIGSSFQEAHGRSQCSEKGAHSFASCSVEQSSTMNAWKVSASTTKLRAVFNASASIKNKRSLNDHLDSGPSVLPDLTGLLLRFWEFKYAFQADIKKALFMIAVWPEDEFTWDSSGQIKMEKSWRGD